MGDRECEAENPPVPISCPSLGLGMLGALGSIPIKNPGEAPAESRARGCWSRDRTLSPPREYSRLSALPPGEEDKNIPGTAAIWRLQSEIPGASADSEPPAPPSADGEPSYLQGVVPSRKIRWKNPSCCFYFPLSLFRASRRKCPYFLPDIAAAPGINARGFKALSGSAAARESTSLRAAQVTSNATPARGTGTQPGMLRKGEEGKSNPSEFPPPFPVFSIPSAPLGTQSVPLEVPDLIPMGKKKKYPNGANSGKLPGVTEVTPRCHCPLPWSQGGTSRWDGETQREIEALCRKPPQNVLQPLFGFSSPFPPHENKYFIYIYILAPQGIPPKAGYQGWGWAGLSIPSSFCQVK